MTVVSERKGRVQRGAHRSLRAAIYFHLREDVLTGRLPPGKPISVKDAQSAFGVGVSAVREALCQLAADGLVIAEDQRGFRAAPISAKDLIDLTRARSEIESFAIRDAIANGDAHWEARILSEYHVLVSTRTLVTDELHTVIAYTAQHTAFHDALVSACSSDWMQRFRRTLHDHSERYRRLAKTYASEHRDIMGEHAAMVEAALARDADRAATLITEHVNKTAEILLRAAIPA